MESDPTSLPGRAAPQRWAVLERVSKVATILSILLVGCVQLAVAPEAGWPVRLLAGGAFLVAWMCGARWNQGTSAAVLFVAPMVPVLLATLAAIRGPTSETVWLVAVVGFTLPRISWSRWELPSVWGLLLGGWALTVSLAWPVLVARELGFDVRVVTDVAAINSWSGLSAPHVIAWILHTTLVHLTGLLWLEWLLTRSLTPSRTPPVGHALWIGVTVASVVAIVQGVIDIEFMSTPAWASLRRATATMLDANAYGALAALAGPVAVISLAPLRLTAGPLLAGLALGINWLGLWMSGSRTALVCGIVGTLALAASMLRSGSWSRSGFRWVAWVTAAVVVTGLLWSSAAIGPLQRLRAVNEIRTVEGVQRLWARGGYGTIALQMIREHPLTGVGFGTYHWLAPDYWRVQTDQALPFDNAQNWWRHEIAEFGVVGALPLMAWSCCLCWLIVSGRPNKTHVQADISVRGLLIGLGLISLVGMPTQNPLVMMWFLYLAAWLASLGHPSHRSLHWPSAARLGWPVAATLAVFYAGGHLVLARSSLSVAERAVRAHRDYAVGTYAPESTPGGGEFRWTRADARISLRTRSRVAVLRSWVAHPDAAVRPVTLRIATPCQEILVEELHNERLVSLALELPDDGPLVLLTHVSRTWRPSDYGEIDTRELGAGLTVDFVDSLATASDIDRRVQIMPCTASAGRL